MDNNRCTELKNQRMDNNQYGSAALARDLDADVYDFSVVVLEEDRLALEKMEQRLCRTKPYPAATWEDVVLICKHHFLELARRQPHVYVALKERMADTAQNWKSTADMIRLRFFQKPKLVDAEDGRFYTDEIIGQQFAWGENEFPYFLDDGISHYLFWMAKRIPDEEIERQVKDRVPIDCEYVWAPQKVSHMTIPAIFHVQVFFRRKKQL